MMCKNKSYKSNIVFSLFISIIIITSCKAKHGIFSGYNKEIKIYNLLENIEKNYSDFNTISVKFQIKYEKNEKKQIIHGIYRIKRDSLIWVSMGPTVGMEVFRAVLYNDSISFINRFDKTYYSGNYSYIKELFKISFNYRNIENILSNKLVFIDKYNSLWKDYLIKNYDYEIRNEKYFLISNKKKYGEENILNSLMDTIIILPVIYKIEKLNWTENKLNRKFSIEFSNFKKVKEDFFPNNMKFNIKEDKVNIVLNIKIRQISIDKKLKYPYKIPNKKYKRIM